MASKVWILDTETKGTGANVVPLEKIQRRPPAEPERLYVPPKARPKAPPEPLPKEPHRFKVVDLMTREVLAEDVDARTTVEVLGGVRSIVDINLYVWRPDRHDWRLLPLEDKRALWEFARVRSDQAPGGQAVNSAGRSGLASASARRTPSASKSAA
jgi:hypothetical protein